MTKPTVRQLNRCLVSTVILMFTTIHARSQQDTCLYLRFVYNSYTSSEISVLNIKAGYYHRFTLDSTNLMFLALIGVSKTICLPITKTKFEILFNGNRKRFRWHKRNTGIVVHLNIKRIRIRRYNRQLIYL